MNNVKIAKQLVRIAKSLMANDVSSINDEIEKLLPTVKDDEIKNEIENMLDSKRKIASGWRDQINKINEWYKSRAISIDIASLLYISLFMVAGVFGNDIGKSIQQAYNPETLLQNLILIANLLLGFHLSGMVVVKVLETLYKHFTGQKLQRGFAQEALKQALSD